MKKAILNNNAKSAHDQGGEIGRHTRTSLSKIFPNGMFHNRFASADSSGTSACHWSAMIGNVFQNPKWELRRSRSYDDIEEVFG